MPRDTQLLLLAGRPTLRDFVRFVKAHAVDGSLIDEAKWVLEWQQASKVVRQLDPLEVKSQPVGSTPLPDNIRAAADAELEDPAVRRSIGLLPYSWAWVALDQLIVWQRYINLAFAAELRDRLPLHPTPKDLLDFSAGRLGAQPPLRICGRGGNAFTFSSVSNDLRVTDVVPLDPDCIRGFEPHGRASCVVAVFVGYSINCMISVRMNNRLLLTNGTHRAYALLSRGITHAPCIVRHVSSADDLDLAALPRGNEPAENLFAAPRPPLLKDFFDERLTTHFAAPTRTYLLDMELKFEQAAIVDPAN
jgi:hypothetical protein